MTVTPKQLREAADTLDALALESKDALGGATITAIRLRQLAEERHVSVGTIRHSPETLATYTKVNENEWIAVYPLEDGHVAPGLTDSVVAIYPIAYKPS